MKGYSLVSVLAAMIILMAALVPLLSLQGRILEYAERDPINEALVLIEEDFVSVQAKRKYPKSKIIASSPLVVYRKVTRKSENLISLQYEITTKAKKEVVLLWWNTTDKIRH